MRHFIYVFGNKCANLRWGNQYFKKYGWLSADKCHVIANKNSMVIIIKKFTNKFWLSTFLNCYLLNVWLNS